MNISTYIPATWRKYIYGAFAVIAVALGAVQVGVAATDAGNPAWLNVALAVFPFVATAIGFTASANTHKGGLDAADTLDNRENVDPELFEEGV